MSLVAPSFEAEAHTRGLAHLNVELVFDESTVTSSSSTSPLKLLTPCSRGKSVWAYASSFGGGLVAGDETQLNLSLGAETRCFFGTQASTKVYRNPSRLPCSHTTRASLDDGAVLVFTPDAVQAFAGSIYCQRQEFHLASGSGLVLLDWFTSGRAARGERWEFDHFQSRNDVFMDGERVFVDSISLNSDEGALDSSHRTGRFNCFAALLLIGEPLREIGTKLLDEIAGRPIEKNAALICSASPVREGALLRIAAEDVESAGRELRGHLSHLTELLGDDPWSRKW